MTPPLDPEFRPVALGNRIYQQAARAARNRAPLALALERNNGAVTFFQTEIFALGSENDADTLIYVDRLVKFLLWQRGGWRLLVGGPAEIADHLRAVYSKQGARAFDAQLMADVYERPFVVDHAPLDKMPVPQESSVPLGGHLDGCRIGFDLGASDYKVAAVKDGEAVFTEELPWNPKAESNPDFHQRKIQAGLVLAAKHLPRVDAIGGSAAGIYIANKVMVASLFRAVPKDVFEQKAKPMFLNLRKAWGVPLEVANDGDVTALAGAMSLQVRSVLGIAMGSSQAGGFLDAEGRITGWLNELAFAPVDFNPNAPKDEWSGDRGCGAPYFSQQAVARLAAPAGIDLPDGHPAEQLLFIQKLHAQGDPRPVRIFETIGVYLGYALALYAEMYDFRHVLILGRVTSGPAGDIIVRAARKVLETEFPSVAQGIAIHLPDEKSKRVGQAVAAASLPALSGS